MLTSIPNELQTHILSFLPRKDLAAVARVSQHLHAVAIKSLYLKVVLRSWSHLESFFLPGSLIPSGSISATEHAEARRKHWESIEDLNINIAHYDKRSTKFLVPRSLRGRDVQPLQIERLRVSYDGDLGLLLPLLECMNPKEVFLFPGFWDTDVTEMIPAFGKVGGWTRVDQITLPLDGEHAGHMAVVESDKILSPSFFVGITSGTIALDFSRWAASAENGFDAISFALRLLPSLRHLRVVVCQTKEATLNALLGKGFGGKGPEFFTIEVGDPRTYGRG